MEAFTGIATTSAVSAAAGNRESPCFLARRNAEHRDVITPTLWLMRPRDGLALRVEVHEQHGHQGLSLQRYPATLGRAARRGKFPPLFELSTAIVVIGPGW